MITEEFNKKFAEFVTEPEGAKSSKSMMMVMEYQPLVLVLL